MSYFDDASLVMIPSGYKEDKVYSVKPIDGSGDLDFTRASSATRIGSDGNIEKTRTNSILYSNDFDTGFSKTRASLVSGQSGYDGSSDAWGFVDTADNSTHLIVQTVASSEVATFSVYAKAGAVNFIAFRYEDATVDYAYFDLANGILGTIDSDYITANITSVGNGWYRCEAVRTSANKVVILSAQSDNDPTYAGAGTTAIYIQDSQLEQGLVATSYIETTSTAVSVGSYDNVPRLNYTAGSTSSCPSLLLEPQRTNLIDNSEYFGAWTQLNSNGTTNATISPENVSNAYLLTEDTSNNQHRLSLMRSVTSGVDYVFSVYAKPNGRSKIRVRLENSGVGSGAINVSFDIQNGISLSANGTIENVGNGWYRCIATGTSTSTGKLAILNLLDDDYNFTYTGDGSSGAYFYGAQLEEASYATSYIPTYGATVTRVTDNCEKSGISSLLGQTEGSVFFEYTVSSDDTTTFSRILNLRNASSSEQIYLQQDADNAFKAVVYNGSNQFIGNTTSGFAIKGTTYKMALAYKDSDYAFYIDGVSIETSSASGLGTLSISFIDFDTNLISASNKCKKLLVFKTRLSNTQLAELTT